jgi:hypothetical protein
LIELLTTAIEAEKPRAPSELFGRGFLLRRLIAIENAAFVEANYEKLEAIGKKMTPKADKE